MAKTKEQWLKESDDWDQFSLEELIEMSEPVDWQPVDRRPKKAISIRLDEGMIDAGKRAANDLGLGYQTLFRMWLIEGLQRHRRRELGERRRRSPPSARKPSGGAPATRR